MRKCLRFLKFAVLIMLLGCFCTKTPLEPDLWDPESFLPMFPEDSTILGFVSSINFEWNDVDGTTKYEIQIDSTEDFSFSVVDETLYTSNYNWNNPPEGTFFWKVRAGNENLWGVWTTPRILEIRADVPVLVWPEDGAVIGYVFSINLDWNDVDGATKYQVQIDTTQIFNSPTVDETLFTSDYTWISPPGGVFYWKVRAGNENFWGAWATSWRFSKLPYEVGYYDTPGNAFDVHISGSYAYVADRGAGLRIIDISNPSSPYEVGYCYTAGNAECVYISGSYAYVADRGAGLRIIDISNPSSPYEVGYFDPPGYAFGIFVSGSHAYLASYYNMGGGDIRVINVSNPSAPYEMGYCDTPGWAVDIFVSGSYAYVADGDYGLRVINVSNPSAPYEVGYCDTPGWAQDIFVVSSYVYVADDESGLRVINVSNPSAPYEMGHCTTAVQAKDVFVSGSYAYVADGDYGLRVINVSNPSAPYEVGYCDTPHEAWGIFVSGSYAYVADNNTGIRIIWIEP